jgi:hypothetical protein
MSLVVAIANFVINVENVLDWSGFHSIFIYIPFKVQMFFTFWKRYVIFPLNFLVILSQLFLSWRCHLCLSSYLYHC